MAVMSDATTSGKLTVGVISDIKEFLPETVANLKAFAADQSSGRGLVVVNGDVAYSQKEMESALRRGFGTEFSVPVLVTSGNKELARDFDLALTNIAADHPQIINGNRVRSLTLNDITFVTLPGYGKKNYTEPGACLFGQAEVDETGKLLKAAAGGRAFRGARFAVTGSEPRVLTTWWTAPTSVTSASPRCWQRPAPSSPSWATSRRRAAAQRQSPVASSRAKRAKSPCSTPACTTPPRGRWSTKA